MGITQQTFRQILVLCAISAFLTACAPNYTRINAEIAPRALPPRLRVQRIAVMDFQGPNGREASQELESDLVSHVFNGRPYFTIVDREQTKSLMSEYARDLRGEIDPATAARFGRQIGAQGILFGRVTDRRVDTSYHMGTVLRCVRQKYGLCTKVRAMQTRCVVHRARFAVMARLVNVETAQVVYSKERVGMAFNDSCSGRVASYDDLLSAARAQALAKVIPDIAPSDVTLNVAFKTEPTVLEGIQKDRFKGAVSFAQAGRLDRACEIWRSLNNTCTEKDVAVLYDLAVCEEAEGNLQESLDLVRSADQLLNSPDKEIDASLSRLHAELNQRQRVNSMQ
jgi:Curli production assembly/transport component CsgG